MWNITMKLPETWDLSVVLFSILFSSLEACTSLWFHLTQFRHIVNWTLRNKFLWNQHQNTTMRLQENKCWQCLQTGGRFVWLVFVASLTPSHYLGQSWLMVRWKLGDKLEWRCNLNSNIKHLNEKGTSKCHLHNGNRLLSDSMCWQNVSQGLSNVLVCCRRQTVPYVTRL